MIWRDDDISKSTNLKRFKQIHNLFLKYKVLHTVSLICEVIEENKPLIKYLQQQIKNGSIVVEIHCWKHYDFTENPTQLITDLPKCIEAVTRLFNKPTTLFPPWNKTNRHVDHIAFLNKLEISTQKMSISGYLKGQNEKVINFHFWADECDQLEDALKKYTHGNS